MASVLTHDNELGAGDVRPADHPVVALVGSLAPLDLEQVAFATDADVILVIGVQFLGALVPGQGDLWVVDLDLALKHCLLVGEDGLIGDVPHHGDRLQEQQENQPSEDHLTDRNSNVTFIHAKNRNR